jgi:hypothetical protein
LHVIRVSVGKHQISLRRTCDRRDSENTSTPPHQRQESAICSVPVTHLSRWMMRQRSQCTRVINTPTFKCNSARVGVDTTMAGRSRNLARCPSTVASVEMPTTFIASRQYFVRSLSTSTTCVTSSAVGTSTNPNVYREAASLPLLCRSSSISCVRGSPYATVLPLPVLAFTRTSLPCNTNGIAIAEVAAISVTRVQATAHDCAQSHDRQPRQDTTTTTHLS